MLVRILVLAILFLAIFFVTLFFLTLFLFFLTLFLFLLTLFVSLLLLTLSLSLLLLTLFLFLLLLLFLFITAGPLLDAPGIVPLILLTVNIDVLRVAFRVCSGEKSDSLFDQPLDLVGFVVPVTKIQSCNGFRAVKGLAAGAGSAFLEGFRDGVRGRLRERYQLDWGLAGDDASWSNKAIMRPSGESGGIEGWRVVKVFEAYDCKGYRRYGCHKGEKLGAEQHGCYGERG